MFRCFTNPIPPAILSIVKFDFHGAERHLFRGTIACGKARPREQVSEVFFINFRYREAHRSFASLARAL